MLKKWAKVIDDVSKRVDVGLGDDSEFYKENGYTLMNVEQGVDGLFYVKGYAPRIKPDTWKEERIHILKQELAKWDYIGVKIATGCATIEQYKDIIDMCEEYRKEIRILSGDANE